MWRNVSVLILTCSLTMAQTTVAITAQSGELAFPQATPPSYRGYTYYQRMRPGSQQKAAFLFNLNPGWVMAHKVKGRDIVPMRLEVEGDAGLSVSDINYPTGYKRFFKFRQGVIEVHSEKTSVQFKVLAASDIVPGKHVIRGVFTFQQVDDGGLGPQQRMEVDLPVDVGQQGETQIASEWPFSEPQETGSEKRERWTLIALAPLLLPLVLIEGIVCAISGQDCRC